MQHGYAPVGRHEKPGLRTMDESSILRRRGLQVGEPNVPCCCVRVAAGGGDFVPLQLGCIAAPVLLFFPRL